MSRVVSKHLFNCPLNGELDDEVKAIQKMQAEVSDPEMKRLTEMAMDPDADPKSVATFTRYMMKGLAMSVDAGFKSYIDKCNHTEFKVPVRDGNDAEVPVLVHTPKDIADKKKNAAVIYAHGGGVVGGEAKDFKGGLSHLAVEGGVVFFNVDYRLAPETKFPKNIMDFYCALKHIIENAESLGIDASKISIAGDSGGGYICFATMVMLAQKGEADLVKLAMPGIPMIDDYAFGDLASMTNEEKGNAQLARKIWKCISNDLEEERSNPLLFPAKADEKLLEKMPPTIIWENEFDIFITEASRMANRLRAAGRLLEFIVQPGMDHMGAFMPGTKGNKVKGENFKLAMKEYLL